MTSFSVDMVVQTCCHAECGISFAVPSWWDRGKRETHARFYCPNGHGQSYMGESDLEKVRRERDIARQQVARAEDEARLAKARAEHLQKDLKRRIKREAAGTCPCCNRTFSNMSSHMKSEHPEFVTATGAKVVSLKRVAK